MRRALRSAGSDINLVRLRDRQGQAHRHTTDAPGSCTPNAVARLQGLTSVVDDVVEASVVTLDQGNPEMLVTSTAGLHKPSEREVNLPPSPVRDTLSAKPEDRGAGLLSAPGRSLPSRC